MDNVLPEKQMRLLTEPLYSCWTCPYGQQSFVAMANVGLFFDVNRPPLVPDVLSSTNVERPANLHAKRYRSYFTWEYGKPPDVVIEIVSNREGGEDTIKLSLMPKSESAIMRSSISRDFEPGVASRLSPRRRRIWQDGGADPVSEARVGAWSLAGHV